MTKIHKLLLFTFVFIWVVARMYNFNWGEPYFFHPDERNIASSVTQLTFPNQLNPHFFAYGSLPIYCIYILGVIKNIFVSQLPIQTVTFGDAILISRFFSFLFSLLTVFVLFLIGKKIKNYSLGILLVLFSSTNVGLIQYAHFGTFEMWLTFWNVFLLYACIHIITSKNTLYILLTGIIVGVLLAIKISSAALIPAVFCVLILYIFASKKRLWTTFQSFTILSFSALAVFLLFSPFIILDFSTFRSSMQYEGSVALGTLQVFYTQGFEESIPILYQLTHIYPFLLSTLVAVFFVISIPFFLFITYKQKNLIYLIIFFFFSLLFFSQTFLYAKWTRYIVPTIPFIFLIIGITIHEASLYAKNNKLTKKFLTGIVYLLVLTSTTHGALYIKEVLLQPDPRIKAAEFASKNIPSSSHIASEVYDLGIVPFNQYFPHITLFNFYDLEQNSDLSRSTIHEVKKSDYIILPSERVLKTRLNKPHSYPIGYGFYSNLMQNNLGFTQIYKTSCPFTCQLLYNFGHIEETAFIFDRPTIYIFKRDD